MKNFTSFKDITDFQSLLKTAQEVKENPFSFKKEGENKTIGLIFFNPSLRTRMSTQKAALNIGMQVMVMNVQQDSWNIEFEDGSVMNGNTQEHIKELVQVVSQYCDVIGIRTFPKLENKEEDYQEKVLKAFIEHSNIPIVSLESATLHPLQSFADYLTIQEKTKKKKPKVVLSWAPHPKKLPQAVANSFLEWMKDTDVDLVITHPKGMELSEKYTKGIEITNSQDEALKDADFVYTKNWSSFSNYGNTTDENKWQITKEKMSLTDNGHFMHCLPIRRNVVASDEVIDGKQSLVLKQAKNREIAAQAVLIELLKS